MAKVIAKLRVLDLRNETVHTRWGHVHFDKDGRAELVVPEEELDMLRQTKPFPWLYEAEGEPEAAPDEPAFDVSDEGGQPGGPTIEQWCSHGYKAEAYPGMGYAEVPSAALAVYRSTGVVPPAAIEAARAAERVEDDRREAARVAERARHDAEHASPPGSQK